MRLNFANEVHYERTNSLVEYDLNDSQRTYAQSVEFAPLVRRVGDVCIGHYNGRNSQTGALWVHFFDVHSLQSVAICHLSVHVNFTGFDYTFFYVYVHPIVTFNL